jgi:uncharacterized membrane protein required for colicin V production
MEVLPTWLNPFDVLILLALLAGSAWGFVRGLIRMALSLVVLYVSAVLAMTVYERVGDYFTYMFGLPMNISEGLAFLVILAVTSIVLNSVLRLTYRDTELPGIRQVDQLGGMVIGFFITCIWIGFTILAFAFMLGASIAEEEGLGVNLIAYFQRSNLIPIFYRFLPIALATLRPWMPKGLPPAIFEFRL